MLSEKYSYLACDFETTWLDVSKDEPIQVWIIKCNAKGHVVDAYVSYIAPTKNIKDIKQQVSLITGLSLTDLEWAPPREAVFEHIQKIITPDCVLVWHNIGFDADILHKYRPSYLVAGQIDTYLLAQAMVHFQKSYALESLTQSLQQNVWYQAIYKRIKQEVTALSTMKAHDALYDCVQAAALFFYCFESITNLLAVNKDLMSMATKLDGLRKEILGPSLSTDISQKISFPLMSRPITSATKLLNNNNLSSFDDFLGKKVYVWNLSFKEFLNTVVDKKVVLSFSHGTKLDITKNVLHTLGYQQISYLKQEQYIDQNHFTQWLNKPECTQDDFLFCCKYLSQLEKGMWVIDIRTSADRKIFQAIKKYMPFNPGSIVLCSHWWLYALLDWSLDIDKERLKDYTIIYCDPEWWYTSYNNYSNNSFDFYELLELLESYEYKYKIRYETMGDLGYKKAYESLQDLVKSVSIFIPLLYDEITASCKGRNGDSIEEEPMLGRLAYHRSTTIWQNILEKVKLVHALISEHEQKRFAAIIKRAHALLNSLIIVQRRINGQYPYYTFAYTVNFTDYSEFTDMFAGTNRLQASHIARNEKPLLPKPIDDKPLSRCIFTPLLDQSLFLAQLDEWLKKNPSQGNIFVLSNKKHVSKNLLDTLYANGYHKKYELIVEWMTWGIGKNVMKIAKKGPKVVIGGYHFLLNLFASKQRVDMWFVLSIDWPLKEYILDDIQWYGSESGVSE